MTMLDETKRIYENCATALIPNWRDLDKNELCRKYIEFENDPDLASAYFSAIMISYWPKLSTKNIVRLETGIYDILVDSVLKALKNRSWEDKNSSIYMDPNGPDKAINRIFKHTLINEYVKSNAQKYYADTSAKSLGVLEEETNGYISLGERDDTNDMCLSIDVQDFIRFNFKCKDYFMGFLVHIIAFDDCIEKDSSKKFLSTKKVCHCIHHIDRNWCEKFGDMYGINVDTVEKASKYFSTLKTEILTQKIDWYIRELRHLELFTRG